MSPQAMSTSASFVSNLPPVKDTRIAKALSGLMGHGWLKLEPQVKSAVENAISGGSDDPEGKETLVDAWRAAEAVENFGGLLIEMLMEINDLCGATGEVNLTANIALISPSLYTHFRVCFLLSKHSWISDTQLRANYFLKSNLARDAK